MRNRDSKIVIVVEDTRTGYEVFKLLAENVFLNSIEVYTTSYGSGSTAGGIAKLPKAIDMLIKDKKISNIDVVYIAYDSVVPAKLSDFVESENIAKHVFVATRILSRYKIRFKLSKYTCIEELFMSFDELIDFCKNEKGKISSEDISRYEAILKRIKIGNQQIGYRKILAREIANGKNIENALKDLLSRISKNNTTGFDAFRVSDNKLGRCWKSDCCEVQKLMSDKRSVKIKYCDCYAIKDNQRRVPKEKMQQFKHRLKYLYNHSNFKKQLEELKLDVIK